MKLTLNIDLDNNKAIALVNYLRTLDFVNFEEGSFSLSMWQKEAVQAGIRSLEKGDGIPHDQIVSETKARYPELFKE